MVSDFLNFHCFNSVFYFLILTIITITNNSLLSPFGYKTRPFDSHLASHAITPVCSLQFCASPPPPAPLQYNGQETKGSSNRASTCNSATALLTVSITVCRAGKLVGGGDSSGSGTTAKRSQSGFSARAQKTCVSLPGNVRISPGAHVTACQLAREESILGPAEVPVPVLGSFGWKKKEERRRDGPVSRGSPFLLPRVEAGLLP